MKPTRRFLSALTLVCAATLVLPTLAETNTTRVVRSVVRRMAAAPGSGATDTAQPFHCAGTVVDAAGKPVAGATVESYQYGMGSRYGGGSLELKEQAQTATDGAFDLQISRATTVLVVRKPGLAPTWKQWNPTRDTEERLVLPTPSTLAGVVVDETDKPVPDAEVWVSMAFCETELEGGARTYNWLSSEPARQLFSARTGSEGRFRIEGFPTNAMADLTAKAPGKVSRPPKRDYVSPETMQARAGQQDLKLVVEPAGVVEGKVVGQPNGEPLAGVRITLRGEQASFGASQPEPAQSGADGTFRLPAVVPGSYRAHTAFGTNALPEWVADTVQVTVETGETTRDVKIGATRGGFLEVAVSRKTDHQPLAQISVNAYRESYQGSASTGTNGLALLRLPAGEYQVSTYREGWNAESASATIENSQTNRVEMELSPPPRIMGTVRDPAGVPVAGLRLKVFPEYRVNVGQIKTDAKGQYEFPWNPQRLGGMGNAFCLLARDVEHNLAAAEDIDEETTLLDLKLEPGLVVSGRVEDAAGKPVTNATVQLHLWVGNMGSQLDSKPAKADREGRFEIKALPGDRRYSAWVTARGYGRVNHSINGDSDTNRVELPTSVLLLADRKVAGQVLDADDKPVAGVNINLQGENQPFANARTDDQGRFSVEACEGQARLYASSRSSYGNASAQGGDTNVVIRLGVSTAYSTRTTPRRAALKGKPLPDLAAANLTAEAVPAGKPVLLCLFDLEQRPSRRLVRSLADQHDDLKQKGLAVLGIQAAPMSAETLKELQGPNPAPFPVGRVAEKSEKTRWASEVDSLPWLILTDADHRVAAEGFALDELDARLKTLAK